MTPTTTAIMFTIGATGWVYYQLARRAGPGNYTPAIVGTAVSGTAIFIISYIAFRAILN